MKKQIITGIAICGIICCFSHVSFAITKAECRTIRDNCYKACEKKYAKGSTDLQNCYDDCSLKYLDCLVGAE